MSNIVQPEQDLGNELNLLDTANTFKPTIEQIKEIEDKGETKLSLSEFPWEKALDTYNPAFPGYTPSKDALNFFNICRLVSGKDFEVGNSIAQYFMIDVLFDNVTTDEFPYSKEVNDSIEIDNDRVAICCSRGLSKSTIITNFLFIYVAVTGCLPNYGQQKFWVALGASTRGHARKMALGLKASCETSEYMKDIMEDMHFTETEAHFLRKGKGPEEDRYFGIQFTGIFTPIRGTKSKWNARPDMAILDDCIPTQAASYSKVVMENYNTALYADLGNALKANGGKIWNIFTPFNYNEPNTAGILNGSFTPVLLPVAEAFTDPENIVQEEIVSSWSQMHTQESIYKMWKLAKKSKTLGLFMQERMLRLSSVGSRLIPDNCIQFCDMKVIMDNIHGYATYITTDYTTTSGEKSDFSGIATWAVSNNEDWFLLHLTLRKRTMDEQHEETLNQAAKLKRKGKDVEIGVEVDGNQASHVLALEKLMMKRGDYYNFAREKNNLNATRKGILSKSTGVNKHERFRIASQVFLQNKMWFPEHLKDTPDMIEFVQQIKGATHESFTRSDDGPDLITMALVSMNVVYPTESTYTAPDAEAQYSDIWDEVEQVDENRNSVVF